MTLCLRPISAIRFRASTSQVAADLAGAVPSTIQSRQALVLSLAHQMSRDFSGESPPKMGYKNV